MSLFQTPPRAMKTRAQMKKEIMANEEVNKLEVKSDVQFDRKNVVKDSGKVKSDIILPCATQKDGGVQRKSSTRASSSAARQKQLEYEAAQAKALIELQEAEAQAQMTMTKARIEKELLDKKLAADLAELEENSRISKQSSSVSYQSKVENWLEKSIAAPGSSLDCCNSKNVRRIGVNVETRNQCKVDASTDLVQRPTQLAADAGTHRAIEALASALRDAVGASTSQTNNNKEILSRLATSKDLPLYFGDPLEWLQFREAFYGSTRLCNYSDAENLWRLRKCLRGDAKEATLSLLMSATSPQDVMETLELRFSRPENIIRKVTTQLRKLQPLPQAYHTEIVNFAIKIKNYVTAIRTIEQSDYLRSPELVTIVVSKLPTALINKWAEYIYEKQVDTPKLELLAKFLYQEAQKIAVSGVSYIYSQNDYKKRPDNTTQKINHPVLTCTDSSNASSKCKFCRGHNHTLAECRRFKRAMRRDRWRYVRVNKLCFKCLGTRHENHQTCTAENCDIDSCGGPHHRLLHWVKPDAARQTTTEPHSDSQQSENELVAVANASQRSEVNNKNIPYKSKSNMSKVLLKIVPVTIHGPERSINTHALLDDGATVSLIAADIANKAGLHGESITMRATSAWDSGELVCKTEIINFDISNSDGNRFKLRARKLKELNLPTQFTSYVDYSTLENVFNDNYNICNSQIKPTLLIGQDNYDLIAPIICKRYRPGGPFVTQTLLGWCVHGALRQVPKQVSCCSGELGGTRGAHSTAKALKRAGKPNACAAGLLFPDCAGTNATTERAAHLFTVTECKRLLSPQPSITTDIRIHNNNAALSTNTNLMELVRRSFSLDSIGICAKPRQNKDELRAISILNESAQFINGQWTIRLPWKSDVFVMPDSYTVALKRLKSVERKMLSNSDYESRYQERIRHLLDNKYARKLSESECRDTSKRIWYLPHFAVDNPNKKKLRLVFDAAAKSNNTSLNDLLLQGPDLLNSLYGIMFRFREHSIGIIGDIKDMFLRIKIHTDDQNALRFLWKEKGSDIVNKYAMTSLIFGANCSPFVAQFINQNKNASRYQDQLPDAVHAIKTSQYMDDYIDSIENKNMATKMIKEISFIHQQGGFEMRNWLSNEPTVLCDVPKETLNDKAVRFQVDKQPERALGLLWFPYTDMLAFDLSFKRIPHDVLLSKRIPTKREMLSIIMSIFDIHGYLVPFIIKGKILMRETWKTNIMWDEVLNDELFKLFRDWINQAQEINKIRIPRWYFRGDPSNTIQSETTLELHVFCDASPCAYAAVAYWRKERLNGGVTVSFVASKCKVSPVKPISVPRLELQGAVLACRLAAGIKKEHRLHVNSVYYWTDSTTVLHWISNQCRTYKTFIANRLGEIDELSRGEEWHYVPTNLNVADLGTKNTDYVLSSDSEWFAGPSFLFQPRSCWPQHPETKRISDEILEMMHTVTHESNKLYDLPIPDPSRFSSWLRLLRATATALLFIEKCKKKPITDITDELMNKAEILLLRYSQAETFRSEITLIEQNKLIKKESRLHTLTSILDEHKLLRVGGRIGNVKDVDELMKYPIILDGKSHIARLIVMHYHINAAHSSNEMVINELRQKYWLIRLRPTVRTVAKQCLICRFRKALPKPPRLGDLPECRLTHHQRPFTMCGVDLFGPMEVVIGRQRARRYGVLFTCLTVRAVHIEVVPSLTTDSMIMALWRMASRRGWPSCLFSDNGTNLRGADVELKKAYQELIASQQDLASKTLNKGVQWRFIPPASPHMGGAWERLIRSVKTALKVILKERAPKEETLHTFLCEVENMINGRPLTHVSVDPRNPEALTPNHFLLGSSSNLPQPGIFDDSDLYLRKQWRTTQRLADMFWSRWLKEVLPTLAPRQKWEGEGTQLKVGDFVVVVDPNSPRNVWPKGIVQKVYPGADGRVRILDIKTRTGIMKRPATRVALLLGYECRKDDTKGQDVDDDETAHTMRT